jgi:hypothetical protein
VPLRRRGHSGGLRARPREQSRARSRTESNKGPNTQEPSLNRRRARRDLARHGGGARARRRAGAGRVQFFRGAPRAARRHRDGPPRREPNRSPPLAAAPRAVRLLRGRGQAPAARLGVAVHCAGRRARGAVPLGRRPRPRARAAAAARHHAPAAARRGLLPRRRHGRDGGELRCDKAQQAPPHFSRRR